MPKCRGSEWACAEGETTMTDPYASNSLPFFGAFTPKDFTACVTPINPHEVGTMHPV